MLPRELLLLLLALLLALQSLGDGDADNENTRRRRLATEILRDDASWKNTQSWLSSEWAKRGGDLTNSGLCKTCAGISTDAQTGAKYYQRWKQVFPSGIRSVVLGPDSGMYNNQNSAVGDSHKSGNRALYVATKAGVLYKVSRTTGKIVWSRDLRGNIGLGGPVAFATSTNDNQDQVWSSRYDGYLLMGTATGLLWLVTDDGLTPAVHNLRCAGSSDASCQTTSGASKWGLGDSQVALSHTGADGTNPGATYWIATQPITANGATTHFVANSPLQNLKTGEASWNFNWRFDVPGTNNGFGFSTTPTVGPDFTIYIGSDKMYALSKLGALLWSFNDRGDAAFSVVNSAAVYSAQVVYFGAMNGKLYALETASGAVRWAFTAGGAFQCTAALSPTGAIYSANNDGNLYALSSAGVLLWKVSVSGANRQAPITVVSDGSFYFSNIAFSSTGAVKWALSERETGGNNTFAAAVPSRDGTVYLGTEAGTLYALGGNTPDPQTLFLEQLAAAWTAALGGSPGHPGYQAFMNWADFSKNEDGISYRNPVCNDGSRQGDYYPVEWCGMNDGCLDVGFSIRCSRGRLVQLALIGALSSGDPSRAPYSNASISLALPSSIGGLTALTSLNLWCTRTAQLPSQMASLSSSLQMLKIGCSVGPGSAGANLHPPSPGTIPAFIGRLTNLHRLYIGGAFAKNDLPNSLGSLVGLQELYIDRVGMSQTGIPTSLGGLASLTALVLEVPGNSAVGMNQSYPCLPPFLQARIVAGDVRTNYNYIFGINDANRDYQTGTADLLAHYRRYLEPLCRQYLSPPPAAPVAGATLLSAYPSSGQFPSGAAVVPNMLLGVAALPARYQLSFSVNPSASGSYLRTLVLLSSNAAEYGAAGTSLPRVSFCGASLLAATGCPSMGLEIQHYSGAVQPSNVYSTSPAALNTWTSVVVLIDTVARTMSLTLSGGATFAKTVSLLPGTTAEWERVAIFASSPWASASVSSMVRDLSLQALAMTQPTALPTLQPPSPVPTFRTHNPSPPPTANTFFKLRSVSNTAGTSALYTRHVDQACKFPPFGTSYALTNRGAPVVLGACTPLGAGYAKLICKLGPRKYSLDEATYGDGSCATAALSKGVYRHGSVCAWDAVRGGFLKIHCGEDSLPQSAAQIRIGASYSTDTCDPTDPGARANEAHWTGVCSPRYYPNKLRGLAILYNFVLTTAPAAGGGLTVYENRYEASDVMCEHRVVIKKTLRFAPPAAGAAGQCLPDPLDKGRFYINSAPIAVTSPVPTAVPSRAPFAPPSPSASARSPTFSPSSPVVRTVTFSDNFDRYTGSSLGDQRITALPLYRSGSLSGWNSATVDFLGGGNIVGLGLVGQMRDAGTNKALVLWVSQTITQSAAMVGSNRAGWTYSIEFDAAPGSGNGAADDSSRDTRPDDTFHLSVLRADDSVLQTFHYSPGSFADAGMGIAGLCSAAAKCIWDRPRFLYVGDGKGDVRLRFFGDCSWLRVCGAIDNVQVKVVGSSPTPLPTSSPTYLKGAPTPAPTAVPALIISWAARLAAAGTDASQQVVAAHRSFYDALAAAGLLPKITRLNTFSGNDATAALIPLFPGGGTNADTMFGGGAFGGSVSTTGGLTSSGVINTGQLISHTNQLDPTSAASDGSNVHMGLYFLDPPVSCRQMGVFRGSIYTRHYLLTDGIGSWGWGSSAGGASQAAGLNVATGTAAGANIYTCSKGGTTCSSASFSGVDRSQPSDCPVGVMGCIGTNTGVSSEPPFTWTTCDGTRAAGYSIGYALTASDVAALNAAWKQLNLDLGRS